MIVVQLIGGLGNQLFQYAFAKNLAARSGVPFKLDITPFEAYKLHAYSLDALNISAEIATPSEINRAKGSRILRLLGRAPWVHEKVFSFDEKHLAPVRRAYVVGYWQSEKYFKDIASSLRGEFTLKKSLSTADEQVLEKIKSNLAVAVHIRRADYVNNAHTLQVHGVCSPEYYQQALNILAAKVPNMHLFVFSDDPAWAEQNLQWSYPVTFVKHNKADRNYADLFLMSQCQHFVIANSTFSWWAAWLGNYPRKTTIAPQQWFRDENRAADDIIPESWMRL